MKKLKKQIKLIPAQDDWFPCFPGMKVQVSLHQDSNQSFRVAVWGEDDHGMEKVFLSKSDARDAYECLTHVNHQMLRDMGFYVA